MMILRRLALTSLLAIVAASCKMYYPTEKVNFEVGPQNMAEGKRITMSMCGPCHYNNTEKSFSGKKLEDSPKFIGKIYAANITQHDQHGIGNYSDAELAYLMRTGLSKSGKWMPYMYRPNISDEDLRLIIAYLKSNDAAVAPSVNNPGETKYTPMGRFGVSLSKPGKYSSKAIDKPKEDALKLGKYLVDNLGCYHCHSKTFAKLDNENPERSKGFMGGGNSLRDASGGKVKSSNLTPHETGILHWTEEDFKRALAKGISKDNSVIGYPMPLYPELTDGETLAIFTYLKSIPAIDNAVKN